MLLCYKAKNEHRSNTEKKTRLNIDLFIVRGLAIITSYENSQSVVERIYCSIGCQTLSAWRERDEKREFGGWKNKWDQND